MRLTSRVVAGAMTLALTCSMAAPARSAQIGGGRAILYNLNLPGGEKAVVYTDGTAEIHTADNRQIEYRAYPRPSTIKDVVPNQGLPDKNRLAWELSQPAAVPFAGGTVIAVFRDGAAPSQDVLKINAITNRSLSQIHIVKSERLFRQLSRSALSSMHATAQAAAGRTLLNPANAYRLFLGGTSPRSAVAALLKMPAIEYASLDWHVQSMHTPVRPLEPSRVTAARVHSNVLRMSAATIPDNYALSASAQSLLNAPSVDAAAAFDEISKAFNQLPGQGETITNVSIGDLDDASAASNSSDPCNSIVAAAGPTTEILGGQRYINWPSMPLIPTYTADDSGNVNGGGEVCRTDPYLDEVGLDFSMMVALPHALQRSGEVGSGYTDLLGIAPGANYRLVVPASSNPTITDIDAALLGAALQSPRTNVITASLGFSEDRFGFSSRYLEDDPLTEAIVASIVQSYNVVVCIAAGDGVRLFTTAAIGPSGGSTPTDVISNGGQPTNLNDVAFSSAPSLDFDSGAIDSGGTTLDDIFSNDPQYATNATLAAQHAYASTRWTGSNNFSSGFGTRVDLSAPADNVIALSHANGGADDTVNVGVNGGTSASAPEIAAAAAVVLQVSRLTGHPLSAAQVRSFLESTATRIPNVAQADQNINVGPQIDVRRAVETLLTRNGKFGHPSVERVAIEQRRNLGDFDGVFVGDTDPANIDLQSGGTDANVNAWITIAPDWEWAPENASFRLFVNGRPSQVLARTRWARLLPATILSKAGLPLVSSSTRTVHLTYAVLLGAHQLAAANFDMTFGPADATSVQALAPRVPAVVTGTTIPVTYNLNGISDVSNPQVIVSEPGRVNPTTGQEFHPSYTAPISGLQGTLNIPIASLQGGGTYGIGIEYNSQTGNAGDFAYVRVQPSTANTDRPAAPLLSNSATTPGHFLDVPYGSTFQVQYDVRNVHGATGAVLEISSGGPGLFGIRNPFNNPNGSIIDKNGQDMGSVYTMPLFGTSGHVTLNAATVGLFPAFNHVIRIIPMKFGQPAGEAGDVSTIIMDGVLAADGGFAANGYGINENGSDGFLTSNFIDSNGLTHSTLETFSQTTNQIQQIVGSTTNAFYITRGGGLLSNDIGLDGLLDLPTDSVAWSTIDPTTATVPDAWNPPYPSSVTQNVLETALDTATSTEAMLAVDVSQPPSDRWRLFNWNAAADTFGPLYDITGPVSSFGYPEIYGIAQDTATNTAILPVDDLTNFCGTPTMMEVDLGTGNTSTFTGIGAGQPQGIALDAATGKAAVTTNVCDDGFTIYNLASKTGTEIALPGHNPGISIAADSQHGVFLVMLPFAPEFFNDNNTLSQMLVYDENGNLLSTKEQFEFVNNFFVTQANNVQINPSLRTGYVLGPAAQELEPFSY